MGVSGARSQRFRDLGCRALSCWLGFLFVFQRGRGNEVESPGACGDARLTGPCVWIKDASAWAVCLSLKPSCSWTEAS